jgi:hypothetical protein
MTGSLFAFFVHPRLICVELAVVAVKVNGSPVTLQDIKQKVISFVDVFSAMLSRGLAVLAPAQDFELGVVASVNVVLLEVPGQGHPPVLIVEPELSMMPLAEVDVADMGYIPWWEEALISLEPM